MTQQELKNPVNNEAGFSLIEVLVAVAILTVVLGAMISLSINMTRAQRQIIHVNDIESVRMELMGVLQSGHCPTAITLAPGSSLGNGKDVRVGAILSPSRVISATAETIFPEVKLEKLEIVSTQLQGKSPFGNNVYRGTMVLHGQKSKEGEIPLRPRVVGSTFLEIDATGKLVNCGLEANLSQLSAMCTSLGGSFDSTTQRCQFLCPPLNADVPVTGTQGQTYTSKVSSSCNKEFICAGGAWVRTNKCLAVLEVGGPTECFSGFCGCVQSGSIHVPSPAMANAICVKRGYKRMVAFTTAPGPVKATICDALTTDKSQCTFNKNPGNLICKSVTCEE